MRVLFTIFYFITLTLSCDDSGGGDGGAAAPVIEETPAQSPGPDPYEEPSDRSETITTSTNQNFALARLTPEQYSKALRKALGVDTLLDSSNILVQYSGREQDWLLVTYGVSLGGIDYVSSIFRDPSTKAQTLLISRQLAWQISAIAVATEIGQAIGSRNIFKDYDINGTYERPFRSADTGLSQSIQDQIREGEARWETQAEKLFWSFYSRPPTSEEMAAVKAAFIEIYTNESDNNQAAWVGVLYAMLSSQEFWHL